MAQPNDQAHDEIGRTINDSTLSIQEQTQVHLNSKLNIGSQTLFKGKVALGVRTHDQSQDTLLDDILTNRTKTTGLRNQASDLTRSKDNYFGESEVKNGGRNKEYPLPSHMSIFSEKKEREKQFDNMQNKIEMAKMTHQDESYKFNKANQSQSSVNREKQIKQKQQIRSRNNGNVINLTLFSTADDAKTTNYGSTSLPQIKVSKHIRMQGGDNRQVFREQEGLRSMSHLLAISDISQQRPNKDQVNMLDSQYKNLPLKNKRNRNNELCKSVKRNDLNHLLEFNSQKVTYRQTISKQMTNPMTHQNSTISYFGNQTGMGVHAGLGKFKLKETLLRDSTDGRKDNQKAIIEVSEQDLKGIMQGRMPSKVFIEKNKEIFHKYLEKLSKVEGNSMKGFKEYSYQTMGDKMNINPAKNMSFDDMNDSDEMAATKTNLMEDFPFDQDDSSVEDNKKENKDNQYIKNIEEFKLPEFNTSKMGKLSKKNAPKNSVLEASGITSKVMETWLNEILTEAEHLDIPGIILKPEHKNPISRYGIDRMELTNHGIPNKMVDRIYRCLFVYSLGFYNILNKVIAHSQQKYFLICRIWKVFSVILEYCCITDYKMMITKIVDENDKSLRELQDNFDKQCQQFLDQEGILKQNIAVLQRSNEELEKDRTNERNLRLKLEEEYMQNSKNHEEEVKLRLKFESKLNTMHAQFRETEIKLNRALNEIAQLKLTKENQQKIINDNKNTMVEDQNTIAKQSQKISQMIEKNKVLEHESFAKGQQIDNLQEMLKSTQTETNETRYQMNLVENQISKMSLENDIMKTQIQTMSTQNEQQKLQIEELVKNKSFYESENKQIRQNLEEILFKDNEVTQQMAIKDEWIKSNQKQIDIKNHFIQQHVLKIEELALMNRNQESEIESLQYQAKRLQLDFEESADKVHMLNRTRHELELKLEAERKLLQMATQTIKKQEKEIYERNSQIEELKETVMSKHNEIRKLKTQVNEQNNEIKRIIEENLIQVEELKYTIREIEEQVKEIKIELQKAHQVNLDLQEENRTVINKNGLLVKDIKEAKDKEIRWENARAELIRKERKQFDNFSEQVAKVRSKEHELEDIDREFNVQHLELNCLRMQNSELETRLFVALYGKQLREERHSMEVEDLENKGLNASNTIQIMNLKVEELNGDVRSLQTQMQMLAEKYEKGWKDINSKKVELERQAIFQRRITVQMQAERARSVGVAIHQTVFTEPMERSKSQQFGQEMVQSQNQNQEDVQLPQQDHVLIETERNSENDNKVNSSAQINTEIAELDQPSGTQQKEEGKKTIERETQTQIGLADLERQEDALKESISVSQKQMSSFGVQVQILKDEMTHLAVSSSPKSPRNKHILNDHIVEEAAQATPDNQASIQENENIVTQSTTQNKHTQKTPPKRAEKHTQVTPERVIQDRRVPYHEPFKASQEGQNPNYQETTKFKLLSDMKQQQRQGVHNEDLPGPQESVSPVRQSLNRYAQEINHQAAESPSNLKSQNLAYQNRNNQSQLHRQLRVNHPESLQESSQDNTFKVYEFSKSSLQSRPHHESSSINQVPSESNVTRLNRAAHEQNSSPSLRIQHSDGNINILLLEQNQAADQRQYLDSMPSMVQKGYPDQVQFQNSKQQDLLDSSQVYHLERSGENKSQTPASQMNNQMDRGKSSIMVVKNVPNNSALSEIGGHPPKSTNNQASFSSNQNMDPKMSVVNGRSSGTFDIGIQKSHSQFRKLGVSESRIQQAYNTEQSHLQMVDNGNITPLSSYQQFKANDNIQTLERIFDEANESFNLKSMKKEETEMPTSLNSVRRHERVAYDQAVVQTEIAKNFPDPLANQSNHQRKEQQKKDKEEKTKKQRELSKFRGLIKAAQSRHQ